MSTARERVRAEAARRFPNPAPGSRRQYPLDALQKSRRDGFTAGRTVSAEQIEQAAESINEELVSRVDRGEMAIETDGPDPEELERTLARIALAAAGCIVEEE